MGASARLIVNHGKQKTEKDASMPKYVIEREVPGAGRETCEELKVISQTSSGVLSNSTLRSSGSKVMSPGTKSTAFTGRRAMH